MREGDAAEATCLSVRNTAVARELVTAPQDECDAAGLKEHGLFDLLALPTQPLVKRPSAPHVDDAQCDQADALLHY